MKKRAFPIFAYGLTFLMVVLLVAPIIIAVSMSFTSSDSLRFPPKGFSLEWYQAVIREPKWQDRLPVSLEVAALSASAAVLKEATMGLGARA